MQNNIPTLYIIELDSSVVKSAKISTTGGPSGVERGLQRAKKPKIQKNICKKDYTT